MCFGKSSKKKKNEKKLTAAEREDFAVNLRSKSYGPGGGGLLKEGERENRNNITGISDKTGGSVSRGRSRSSRGGSKGRGSLLGGGGK